ncbi:hypothetical protein BDN71DRAFT_1502413 [Pleurotus eryngii]|uniref:Uncharacterized protein n=1 Tax=Pleurotus eryngii TaxID=5323 RepID=A0A9P6A6G5_PLEER|nr:hypothetical protein BDN71DRAFT_1502413 [Pleurotus eryngii]
MEKGHEQGFKTYAVLCGSNIHQNKGLGISEELAGAAGFISDKFQLGQSNFLGHFVSYGQNKLSDKVLQETLGPQKKALQGRGKAATKPRKAAGSLKAADPGGDEIISITSSHNVCLSKKDKD